MNIEIINDEPRLSAAVDQLVLSDAAGVLSKFIQDTYEIACNTDNEDLISICQILDLELLRAEVLAEEDE